MQLPELLIAYSDMEERQRAARAAELVRLAEAQTPRAGRRIAALLSAAIGRLAALLASRRARDLPAARSAE
jgi:hypothetical protein